MSRKALKAAIRWTYTAVILTVLSPIILLSLAAIAIEKILDWSDP